MSELILTPCLDMSGLDVDVPEPDLDRSPDLIPLNFCFWAYFKNRLYETYINDMEHIKEKIREDVLSVTVDMEIRELRS